MKEGGGGEEKYKSKTQVFVVMAGKCNKNKGIKCFYCRSHGKIYSYKRLAEYTQNGRMSRQYGFLVFF
jgi:hypothetical protein